MLGTVLLMLIQLKSGLPNIVIKQTPLQEDEGGFRSER